MKAILTIGQGMYKFTKEMEVPDNDAPTKIYVPFLYAQESEPKTINFKVTKLIFMLDKIETLPSGEKVALFTLPGGGLKTTGDILEM